MKSTPSGAAKSSVKIRRRARSFSVHNSEPPKLWRNGYRIIHPNPAFLQKDSGSGQKAADSLTICKRLGLFLTVRLAFLNASRYHKA
jgi:hypothetical protein